MPSSHRLAAHVALALAASCHTTVRADEAIVTDRPDFVESSAVVGRGRWQIETSVAGSRDTDALGTRRRSTSMPTLVRVGVGERAEMRLETDGRTLARSQDAGSAVVVRESGWADASIGVKWHQQDGEEASGRPGIAWLVHADLDSGSAPLRGRGVRPSLRMVAEWELPGEWSLGVMPGLFADRDDAGRRFVGGIFAATLGRAWTPAWRTFVEVAGQQIAPARHGGTVLTFDAGVALLVSPSVQLDAAFARGLNRNAPDLQWTVGVSVRF